MRPRNMIKTRREMKRTKFYKGQRKKDFQDVKSCQGKMCNYNS